MKYFLLYFFIAITGLLNAQWADDFIDGDFTASPTWSGQDANFEVDAGFLLHLNAPAISDTSYLSVVSDEMENATWEFYVELGFNPSGSNLARVYLASNQANLKGNLNGYFVMIGNTNDEISLYRQDGLTITKIIDGTDGLVASTTVTAQIQVTRDASGNWELLADNTGGTTYVSQGTITDNTYPSSSYAGVHCKYTSTRSDKFYFDNFNVTGTPFVDNVLPFVQSVTATSNNTVDVLFSEDMDQTSVETITNFSLDNGIGNPITAILDGSNLALVHLTFSSSFQNNTNYFLTTTNVDDLAGNTLTNSVDNFLYFVSDTAGNFEVLITEFMADYSPAIGLPELEYIEIYNNSTKTFDLNNWTVSDASSSSTLGTYVLAPNEYVILATGDNTTFGQSNILNVSLPSLNNTDDQIILKNSDGLTIDSIAYNLSWYHDTDKDDGGWSIERKRLSAQCSDYNNWGASTNTLGGTPGLENSIYTTEIDDSAPIVTNYYLVADTLNLIFDESVDITNMTLTIKPNISVISSGSISESQIFIELSNLQANTLYTGILNGVTNCWGTSLSNFNFDFGKPSQVEQGDVVINEIMFNPLTNGSDYIEIVNISDKILDIQNWSLANIDNDTIDNHKLISTAQKLFLPGDYLLITSDSTDIIHDFSVYGIGNFINATLPTYANDSGSVILISNLNEVLDFVHYDEAYHFELLSTADGKSLERLSFTNPSNSEDNWHTASELVDWGTPGYENSQIISMEINGNLTLENQIFSPDNDGYQDVMVLNYEFENPENVMDVQIYDSEGRLIRNLKDNFYPGTNGFITWDGINDENTKALSGSYVVLITIFDLEGNRQVFKKVVVLATKF